MYLQAEPPGRNQPVGRFVQTIYPVDTQTLPQPARSFILRKEHGHPPPRYLSAIAQAVSGETAKNIIDKHVILEIKVLLESTDLTYRK